MPTRDEKLDELLDQWEDARLEWMRTSTNTRPTFAVSDALDAIHAHVEARVLEAYQQGVASKNAEIAALQTRAEKAEADLAQLDKESENA